MAENPDHQGRAGDDRNGSSSEDQKIAVAINSFKRSYKTAQRQRGEHDGKSLKWTRRTAVAAITYTFLTTLIVVAAGYTVYVSSDTAHRQLRAYVGPVVDSFRLTRDSMVCPDAG